MRWKSRGVNLLICIFVITYCCFLLLKSNENHLQNKEKKSALMRLNPSRPGERKILIYNRIPKAGSGSMIAILTQLQKVNNFSIQVGGHNGHKLTDEEQRDVIRSANNLPNPGILISHFYHVNFTRFNETKPMYMNLIRDPAEKIVSRFYFDWVIKKNKKVIYNSYDMVDAANDLINCSKTYNPLCTYVHGVQHPNGNIAIPYFCGSDIFCSIAGSKDALEKAKYVIESSYTVVGVLENLHMTLSVLEHYLPDFFANATASNLDLRKRHEVLREHVKDMLIPYKTELKKNMTVEYELYDFISQRLVAQYHRIK